MIATRVTPCWRICSPGLRDRLAVILASWEGTPYAPGMQQKGMGTDCVRFVCGVLDELVGVWPYRPLETLPHDAAVNNRKGAINAMRTIRKLYDFERVRDGIVEPGDVIVTGPPRGGPGHAMIVGHQRNTVWHAAAGKVHWTGLGFVMGCMTVFAVYRLKDRALCSR